MDRALIENVFWHGVELKAHCPGGQPALTGQAGTSNLKKHIVRRCSQARTCFVLTCPGAVVQGETEMAESIAYEPVILTSMTKICKRFGVGQSKVREWVEAGAPIAVTCDDRGNPVRYMCEVMRLYAWLENNTRKS